MGSFFISRERKMTENGLYIIKSSYFQKFQNIGCKFKDCKDGNRPVFCCIQDHTQRGLFWAIPTSEITRQKETDGTISRVKKFISYPEGSLGWAYYHIGKTNKPAIFNISSVFPMIDQYVEREWLLSGKPFIVPYTSTQEIIKKKLRRILSEELRSPDSFEQHITTIKTVLINELK